MSNKKKRKKSPTQRHPSTQPAGANLAKLVSSVVKNMAENSATKRTVPTETLGQHIARLGINPMSVDVDGKRCIAIDVEELVQTELNVLTENQKP